MKKSTTRFSDRVEDYVKYRPKYPKQLIEVLQKKTGLNKNSIVADFGSGTGIGTTMFLDNQNKVYAIEPNKAMREAAELAFFANKNFISINGTAENSGLKEKSIDIIFSAQAFHWFEKEKTKIEFKRILKPGGHIVLVWNIRKEDDEFQKGYESILSKIPDYLDVSHHNVSEKDIAEFFSPEIFHKESLHNYQALDLEGLKGRLRSSSYFPKKGNQYKTLINEATSLFQLFQKKGLIEFKYNTYMYWC